jgi:hypothetical protein
MKYNVCKLDGRFSYNQWFKYYIGFSSSMAFDQGPLHFTQVQKWCFQTWDWSAEVRQWNDIYRYHTNRVPMMRVAGGFVRQVPKNLPEECNSYWSWSNGFTGAGELRIYLKSEAELAFLQLAFPVDQ